MAGESSLGDSWVLIPFLAFSKRSDLFDSLYVQPQQKGWLIVRRRQGKCNNTYHQQTWNISGGFGFLLVALILVVCNFLYSKICIRGNIMKYVLMW